MGDISRFFPRIDRIFSGEALNPFFGAQDERFFWIFVHITTFSFLMLNQFT